MLLNGAKWCRMWRNDQFNFHRFAGRVRTISVKQKSIGLHTRLVPIFDAVCAAMMTVHTAFDLYPAKQTQLRGSLSHMCRPSYVHLETQFPSCVA